MNRGLFGGLPGAFESPAVPLTSGANISVRFKHGLGGVPKRVYWVLVCVRSDLNYATGDELDARSMQNGGYLFSSWSNATEVAANYPAAAHGPNTYYKDSSVSQVLDTGLTLGRWAIKCYASLNP